MTDLPQINEGDPLDWFCHMLLSTIPKTDEVITLSPSAFVRLGMLLVKTHPEWAMAYMARVDNFLGAPPSDTFDHLVELFPIEGIATAEPDLNVN
jgi:hypothetical protein